MVEEYFYDGSIEKVKEIISSLGAERVFLVRGKRSYELSGAREKLDCIRGITEFTSFSSNPTLDEVKVGMEAFDHDAIVAVGGGSAIDVAKLINILSFQEHAPEKYVLKKKFIEHKGKPLIAVPTTAGTGSESTHFAVVYMGGKKYSVAHDHILSDHVILDAELTLTLPKYQTACTGMDALCQGIESYWSIRSTEKSKEYARKAIELVLENITKVVQRPDDLGARRAMLLGANYSGKAINISKTTAPHACSYVISTRCGIPHGHAVALMMKEFIRYNGVNYDRVVDERGEEYVRTVMDELYSILGCSGPEEASKLFASKMEEVGLETSLGKVCKGIDVEEFVEGVNVERLGNNPVFFNERKLRRLFHRRLEIG